MCFSDVYAINWIKLGLFPTPTPKPSPSSSAAMALRRGGAVLGDVAHGAAVVASADGYFYHHFERGTWTLTSVLNLWNYIHIYI